jgi:flagellar assembly protein FliH
MAGFIPKERLAGYQRWQVASFDQPASQASPETSTPTFARPIDESKSNTGETIVEMPFPTADALEKINEEARTEGYRVGYEEGRAAIESELAKTTDEQIQQLCAIVGNLHVSIAHLDQNIADQLLDLGLEIAAQVLRGSLSVQRELLLPMIREAIAELPFHHGAISLHLNPEDASALRTLLSEQLAHTGAHIVPDSNISAGGCQITAGNCGIDASIETRWKRVVEAIGVNSREWLNQT